MSYMEHMSFCGCAKMYWYIRLIKCTEPESHLGILLNELGPAPAQISRTENKSLHLSLFSRWDQTTIKDTGSANASDNYTKREFLYYDTKALFVQLIRQMPSILPKIGAFNPAVVAQIVSTSKEPSIAAKGAKLCDMLKDLEAQKIVNPSDNYAVLSEEILTEINHLGDLKGKIKTELESLQKVQKTIMEHNAYLRSQLDSYKSYLQNVRVQTGNSKPLNKMAPVKFSYQKLIQEGLIVESNVPEARRANIFFQFGTPAPGSFLISLHYKGIFV
jgi:Ras GTPase-activating-like protein IQGAP2/3